MKRQLAFIVLISSILAFTSCKYNDDDLWDSIQGLENRVEKLEELCSQINTNISSLQTLVTALQDNNYITDITSIIKDNREIGYTITFSKGNSIAIYHGKDGQDGDDGETPIIGVKQDTDGLYYWTLNGEWLTDQATGVKIKAQGIDGQDGSAGESGITPKLKIENGYWFISYDNGESWEQLGKATGENGINGDSMFSEVDYKTSTDYIMFTLSDGTQIKLPTWSAFEALQRLCNETNTNLSALQTIVTALQDNDYITGVDPLTEDGKIVGYTIKFAKNNPIVIYNGKDGINGNTPKIGVKMDSDGIYYWTLNGEWLPDPATGAKIKAQGIDGQDGEKGITPKLKIEDNYWFISYNNGESWEQLGKATGENGQDGSNIEITQDENNVYFKLPDGSIITISKTGQTNPDPTPSYVTVHIETAGTLSSKLEETGLQAQDLTALKITGELNEEDFRTIRTSGLMSFLEDLDLQEINITRLPDGAFQRHPSLKTVCLPAKLIFIGESAFEGCLTLRQLNIPATVETIGKHAFAESGLSSIIFEKNAQLTSIEGAAFFECVELTEIEIPASLQEFGVDVFGYCANLNSVTFEKGAQLKTIDLYIYSECNNLTIMEIPESIETITGSNGDYDTNLRRIYVKAVTPPVIKGEFSENTYKNTQLQVPIESLQLYKEAEGWQRFVTISASE